MTRYQKIVMSITLAAILVLLYFLKPILAPFLIAALFAYFGNPLVNKLQYYKLPRTLAVVIVFCCMLLAISLLIVLLVPLLQRQLIILIQKIPAMLDFTQTVIIPWVSQQLNGFGIAESLDIGSIKTLVSEHWQQAGSIAEQVVHTVSHSSAAFIAWIIDILLIPVVTFYLLRDWPNLLEDIEELLPRKQAPQIVKLLNECNEVLGAFFRGQFLVMIILGVIYAIGLSIMGLQLALLIGLIAGLLSIVPYLGMAIGLISALLAALLQFHDGIHLIYVLLVFLVGHIMEGMVLTPWLVGDKIGLHPVAVIFAILAGGQLFGFIGVLLALPVAAVLMVLLRHLKHHYLKDNSL